MAEDSEPQDEVLEQDLPGLEGAAALDFALEAASRKAADALGHLHLKWGEGLFYAGRKDEAQKQFAEAARLDLSVADKAQLASARRTHG